MRNIWIAGLAALVLFLTVSSRACADPGFKSDEEFGEWMTFYYRHPDPERVTEALEYFSGSSFYGTNATMPTVAFFSALFKKYAGLMGKAFDEISQSGSENSRIMLINILSLANIPESKELLEKAKGSWKGERLQAVIARKSSGLHQDFYSMAVDSPLMLDMLWASFFATGDDLPVQRIISTLHLYKDGSGEDIMVGGAANWSLRSNIEQHPRVREICQQELLTASRPTKDLLEEMVK